MAIDLTGHALVAVAAPARAGVVFDGARAAVTGSGRWTVAAITRPDLRGALSGDAGWVGAAGYLDFEDDAVRTVSRSLSGAPADVALRWKVLAEPASVLVQIRRELAREPYDLLVMDVASMSSRCVRALTRNSSVRVLGVRTSR